MFCLFAISDLSLALSGAAAHSGRLFVLAAGGGVAGLAVLLTRPPERGSLAAHLLVTAVYLGPAFAIYAHAPQGAAPTVTAAFIPVLLALWITERRHAIAHLVVAWGCVLLAASSGGNDTGTIVAAICFVPTSALLYASCVAVLDALDTQAAALDTLGLRDPLTGLGNDRMLDEELEVELTRHRSAGRPLTVVDLTLRRFADLNAAVGPAAGDAVITGVARALTLHAPVGATLARVAGDRFTVILPDRDAEQALAFATTVASALPQRARDHAIELLIGTATYPADGEEPATLMSVAAERRTACETTQPSDLPRPTAAHDETWTVVAGDLEAVVPPPPTRRVSRSELATDRLIWRATAGGFVVYAAVGLAVQFWAKDLASTAVLGVSVGALFLAVSALLANPPHIDTRLNHAVIAAGYLAPLGAMLAAAPNISWVVGTGVLAPLLAAVRLTSRRQIVAHLASFSLLAIVLMLTSASDGDGRLAIGILLTNTWVLGICVAVVFDAAERQTAEISRLMLRDPLTGVGNAELVHQRISDAMPRHDALQLPLTLLAFDALGFDDLVRADGRGNGNHVLRDLATLAVNLAGPHATVARTRGSAFQILLPFTEAEDIDELARRLRRAVAVISRRGRHLDARIGIAEYPADARDPVELSRLADARRHADDPASHDLRDDLVILSERQDAADVAFPDDTVVRPERRVG
jgi:diguanylate cyclase (GGDEF)-like protein